MDNLDRLNCFAGDYLLILFLYNQEMGKAKPFSRGKKLILLLLVLAIGGFFVFAKDSIDKKKLLKDKYKNFSVIDYQLEGKKYKLLVADTAEKQEKGLMFYRELDGVDGMVFVFPDKQTRSFWNKNTLMDLELLWIADDKLVGRSQLPSIEKSKEIVTVESPGPADKVIELAE